MTPLGLPVVPDVNSRSAVLLGLDPGPTLGEGLVVDVRHDARGDERLPPLGLGREGLVFLGAQHHDALEVGQVVAVEHRHVVVVEEAVDRDQHPGPAATEDVGGLGPLEAGVERHEHAPTDCRPSRAATHSAQFGAQMATRSPTLDARSDEGTGGGVDLAAQVGPRPGDVAVDDGLPVAATGDRVAHQVPDGAPAQVGARVVAVWFDIVVIGGRSWLVRGALRRPAHAATRSSTVVTVASRASVWSITASAYAAGMPHTASRGSTTW
jgi:hypothetical protein